jgi:hypothetical protein
VKDTNFIKCLVGLPAALLPHPIGLIICCALVVTLAIELIVFSVTRTDMRLRWWWRERRRGGVG